MVYAAPSVKLTPVSPYAIVNGNAIDVRLVLDDVNDPSMQKPDEIQISTAEWDGATKDINNELLASFNPKDETVGNKVITTKVEWYYMDGDNKIPLYNKTLTENKGAASIMVYAAPNYKLSTEEIYYSFVEVEIPISSFVTSVERINSDEITESIFLTVDTDTPRKTYIPTTTANKEIKLNVQYKHDETILYDRKTKYTINIIENPNWRTNFKDIFGTNSDGDEDDDLHTTQDILCNGGKELQVKLDNCVDGMSYDAKCSYGNNITRVFSNSDDSNGFKILALSDFREKLQEGENEIQFTFSYSVEPLLDLEENNKLLTKTTNKRIIVWENIMAFLPEGFSNQFYTRVGDGTIDGLKVEEISLSVDGGDPKLWKFELQEDNNENVLLDDDVVYDENNGVKINIDYERLNFSEECTKSYKLYAKYVDGLTKIGTDSPIAEININVGPEPELNNFTVKLGTDGKDVTYRLDDNGNCQIECYQDDNIMISCTPTSASDSSWKYQVENNTKQGIVDNIINFDSNQQLGTIKFYSYLKDNSKERLVKTINLQVDYLPTPSVDFNHNLPDVNEENKEKIPGYWENTSEDNRLDLYAGWGRITLNFEPQGGYNEGWTRKLDGNDVSDEKGFDYELKDPTDDAMGYEDKVISFYYKNSIPASYYQKGENVGLEKTKSYHVRVWRKAEMPTKIDDISLKDNQNVNNKVNETMAIREGNDLELSFPKIKYCFVPKEGNVNTYVLKDDKGNSNSIIGVDNTTPMLSHTIESIENEETNSEFSFGTNTYTLVISNPGPRDIPWEKYEIPVEITVYNRPKTPSSLVLKGSGTSGTLIITYDQLTEYPVQVPEDYYIVFRYPGCEDEIRKSPDDGNDRRWVATGTKITEADMEDAYAFSRLIHKVDGEGEKYVWISSGKITESGKVEKWDCSEYNKTKEQTEEDRAITRAGGGDYTAIQSVESEEGVVSVYNTSGVKVATSTENLKPGIYIIRSMQSGEMNSKKLSVK